MTLGSKCSFSRVYTHQRVWLHRWEMRGPKISSVFFPVSPTRNSLINSHWNSARYVSYLCPTWGMDHPSRPKTIGEFPLGFCKVNPWKKSKMVVFFWCLQETFQSYNRTLTLEWQFVGPITGMTNSLDLGTWKVPVSIWPAIPCMAPGAEGGWRGGHHERNYGKSRFHL